MSVPRLSLPSWAVSPEIIAAIRAQVQDVMLHMGDDNGAGRAILSQLAAMNRYLVDGVWSIDVPTEWPGC